MARHQLGDGSPRKQFGKMSEDLIAVLDERAKALDMNRRWFTELTLREALGIVLPEASSEQPAEPAKDTWSLAKAPESPAMERQRRLNASRKEAK
jgi:hypothetical protein